MIYAILNSDKIEATPKALAKCPLCEKDVFAKCGEINIWHWAHHKDESCDSWYEPETLWHKNWKLVFGKDNSEVIIKHDGIRHIADINSKSDVVIELQNSPIQKQIIRKREEFYGQRMLWLINGAQFVLNFSTRQRTWPINWTRTFEGWVNISTGEVRSLLEDMETKDLSFYWSWARKSWEDVQRPVFIDFGRDKLFWVKDGMGTSCGTGINVLKKNFIKKYQGNSDLLRLVI